jgi:5-methylcytosine-specific restriction endonuclease McrA
MRTNIFATAVALSDHDLLARIDALAGTEREATAELVAHLAVLETRPSAYLGLGYGSLFAYCTQGLRLSEDAACSRIGAAKWCRLFPVAADLLASGAISLTSVRLLGPHLTEENHQAVLARATNKSCKEVEALVAELAPQPDVAASVRKLPAPRTTKGTDSRTTKGTDPSPETTTRPDDAALPFATSALGVTETRTLEEESRESLAAPSAPNHRARTLPPAHRPVVKASAPERYRVQFTIDQATHDTLGRVQALMRREIPSGDPGLIFAQALELLREKIEKAKLGSTARPRRVEKAKGGATGRAPQRLIRLETDKSSRHIPSEVKRAVWLRDRGQCAFVASAGRRCTERTFLELHHIHPYAMAGPATVENIALRCRRHNQYEAELIFGPRDDRSHRDRQYGSGFSAKPGVE